MKKTCSLFLISLPLLFSSCVEEKQRPLQNTYNIEGDTKEVIIEKAASIVPTPNQMQALENEFIAFIHLGPNTFTRLEWGNGKEDPKIFELKELDTDQWCEAMVSAGMKMVILTVKHHDGFVLWQSRYTDHGIMSTDFRDGKGDILRDLSDSCQKFGLKLGVYLSPADLFQIENEEGLYGNLSEYSTRTIPRDVEGRPFANKTTFEFEVDDYNEYFLNQLFELLTEYGPIHEVWFDGAHPKTKGGQKYNYLAWKELIHTLAPEAVIFGREDIRWCGNESGNTRDTEWNVVPYTDNPNTTTHFPDMTLEDLGGRNEITKPEYTHLHYQQAETNTSIREGWFYRDDTHQKVRSTDDVFDIYERSVGGNSTFLLNIPPNREGKFSPKDIEVLKETGQRIKETYGVNLLDGAKGPKNVLDGKKETYVVIKDNQQELVITTPNPITLNRLLIQESITTHSERVEKHVVEAMIDDQWQVIAEATNIGYKRILRFPEVTTNKIRITFPETRLQPAISNVSAHYYKSRPPLLKLTRDRDGLVTISPLEQEFNWKPHGQNIAENLNEGYNIYYTTDGTEPTANSIAYNKPFTMAEANIKATAILNNLNGPVLEEQLGFIKKEWKLFAVNTESERKDAGLAFDENPRTYWQTSGGTTHNFIAIDLAETKNITGFAYTPPTGGIHSMMSKGKIKVSNDGSNWQDGGTFEFGNLINDPSKRYYHLDSPISGRYVRFEVIETADKGNIVTIAELDIF